MISSGDEMPPPTLCNDLRHQRKLFRVRGNEIIVH